MVGRADPGLLLLGGEHDLVLAAAAGAPAGPEAAIPGLTASAIERVFATTFPEQRTVLVGGGDEPMYEPPDGSDSGRITYRADYAASALHEVAHWCVAGRQRRAQLDYGYWYAPDGRSPAQQAEFERVEVKPQALEWVFAEAAGVRFVPSADNVEAGCGPSEAFVAAIRARRDELLAGALRGRGLRFRDALAAARRAGPNAAGIRDR